MNTYAIYKAIKQRLTPVAPCFYYLGQYLSGKDNTSYKVPAIYIEMPKNLATTFLPRKLMVAEDAQVKIHLLTNAPFKNNDNVNQDAFIAEHQAKLDEIDRLLTGWAAKTGAVLLTNQLIPIASNNNNFDGVKVFSVKTYSSEFYSRHLQ